MKKLLLELLAWSGLGTIVYGISLLNVPAAVIFGGFFLIVGAVAYGLKD